MYQVVPLLLILAMLMPWTSPADPGNRIAAANAADGLAEQLLIYHQAAISYVLANPRATGVVVPALPAGWSSSGIASCAKAQIVVTYAAVPSTVSKPAVAAAMARLWGRYPLAGQVAGNALTNPVTGVATATPCAIADQTPAIVSQAGG
jgi:hypothetical protein